MASRYTIQEDARILEVMNNHPHNLRVGMDILALELDRSPNAISMRWYRHVSVQPGVKLFIGFGTDNSVSGRKNLTPKNIQFLVPNCANLWQRLRRFFIR